MNGLKKNQTNQFISKCIKSVLFGEFLIALKEHNPLFFKFLYKLRFAYLHPFCINRSVFKE